MPANTDHPLDTARCPLCGSPNLCAVAADPSASQCWCEGEQFPRALLAQVPEEAVGKACICRACLEHYRSSRESAEE